MLVIDHHAHFVPASYRAAVAELPPTDRWSPVAAAFLARFGVDGSAPSQIETLNTRIAAMDAAGIDVQILSLGASTIWHESPSTRRALVTAFNDGTLEAVARHPGRF